MHEVYLSEKTSLKSPCLFNLRRTSLSTSYGVLRGSPRTPTLLVIISKTNWNFVTGFKTCLKQLIIFHLPNFHQIWWISILSVIKNLTVGRMFIKLTICIWFLWNKLYSKEKSFMHTQIMWIFPFRIEIGLKNRVAEPWYKNKSQRNKWSTLSS